MNKQDFEETISVICKHAPLTIVLRNRIGSIFRRKGRIASLSSAKLETFKGWISLCDLAELHLVDSSWWDPEGDRLFYEILDGGELISPLAVAASMGFSP